MTRTQTTLPSVDWLTSAAYLDFDGTLVDLAERPGDVRLETVERDLLRALCRLCDGGVAVLSGRDLDDLRPYLDGVPVTLSGSHGAQIEIDGDPALTPDTDPGIEEAFRDLKAFADRHHLLIEKKAAAIALHYRASPEMEDEVKSTIDRLARAHSALKAVHGNMVSELASSDYSKGTALTLLGTHARFAGRTPVAVGDDTTDEDMFEAAQSSGGIGIRIGGGPTKADFQFETRRDFIDWMARTTEGA